MKNLTKYREIVTLPIDELLESSFRFRDHEEFIRELMKREDVIVTNNSHNNHTIWLLLDNGYGAYLEINNKGQKMFRISNIGFGDIIDEKENYHLLAFSGNFLDKYNNKKIDKVKKELSEICSNFVREVEESIAWIEEIVAKLKEEGFCINPKHTRQLFKCGLVGDQLEYFQIRFKRMGNDYSTEKHHFSTFKPNKDLGKSQEFFKYIEQGKAITLDTLDEVFSIDQRFERSSFLYDFMSLPLELLGYFSENVKFKSKNFKLEINSKALTLSVNGKLISYGTYNNLTLREVNEIRDALIEEIKKVAN